MHNKSLRLLNIMYKSTNNHQSDVFSITYTKIMYIYSTILSSCLIQFQLRNMNPYEISQYPTRQQKPILNVFSYVVVLVKTNNGRNNKRTEEITTMKSMHDMNGFVSM